MHKTAHSRFLRNFLLFQSKSKGETKITRSGLNKNEQPCPRRLLSNCGPTHAYIITLLRPILDVCYYVR